MDKAIGGMHSGIHSGIGINVVPLERETLAEMQQRDPVIFSDHQISVLNAYLSRMYHMKMPSYVGDDVKNFATRSEALDSGERLIWVLSQNNQNADTGSFALCTAIKRFQNCSHRSLV